MAKEIYTQKVTELLSLADVRINGDRPWDLQVHNDDLFERVLGSGSLGLGEAYMESWWDCQELDEFFSRVIRADLQKQVHTLRDKLFYVYAHFVNRQKGKKAFEVGSQHYDAGNDLYERM